MSRVERDYISDTSSFSLSQSMFGDLTTITLGFANTHNKVGENNGTADKPNVAWLGHALTRSYSGGLSQIITKNFIAGVNLQVITDAGYLANPYRSIRFLDGSTRGYGGQPGVSIRIPARRCRSGEILPALPRRRDGCIVTTAIPRRQPHLWRLHASIANGMLKAVRYYKQSAATFTVIYSLCVLAEFHRARPKSRRIGQHHARRQGHLCVFAGRLEVRNGTVTGDEQIRFNYKGARDSVSAFSASLPSRPASISINSAPRSIGFIDVFRLIRPARATKRAASGERRRNGERIRTVTGSPWPQCSRTRRLIAAERR
jgi:hypothetical protein